MKNNIIDFIKDQDHSEIIRVDYPEDVFSQAKRIIKHGVNDEAVKRKYVEGISIDGIESLDLDDAIWAERTSNGYCLWGHISDVTEAIKIYTPGDLEALRRTTSIYRKDGVLNMLHPLLSTDILSLNDNGEKLTITVQVDLDQEGNVLNTSYYESIFKNLKRYDYESFSNDFNNPEGDNHETLHLLYEIATKLRTKRIIDGAVEGYDESDRRLYIGNKSIHDNSAGKKTAYRIIEETMKLINGVVGNIGLPIIYRLQDSINEHAYYTDAQGIHKSLAKPNYTHFSSPIRRYSDIIVHRVLKQVKIRGEVSPYSDMDLKSTSKHINIAGTMIKILGVESDNEIYGQEQVEKLQKRHGDELKTHHLKYYIRNFSEKKLKFAKVVVDQIVNNLENGHIGDWIWAVGIFMISKEKRIIEILKKRVIDDQYAAPKAFLSQLEATVIERGGDRIFDIIEEDNGKEFRIKIFYKGDIIVEESIIYKDHTLRYIKNDLREGFIGKLKGLFDSSIRINLSKRHFDFTKNAVIGNVRYKAVVQLFEYALNKRHDV